MDNKEKGRAILLGLLILGGGHLYLGEIKKGLYLLFFGIIFGVLSAFLVFFSQIWYVFIIAILGLYVYSLYDLLEKCDILQQSKLNQTINKKVEPLLFGMDNKTFDLMVVIGVSIYIFVMVLIIWYS